jgi:Phosphopantetheine attachment site
LLAVEQAGIGQNFFELGGRSLLVLPMIDRIRRIFELELPVRRVFDEPTIEDLAGELQKAQVFRIEGSGSDCDNRSPLLRSPVPAERALLSQLSELSADEAQNLIKRAPNSKPSA